MVWDDTAYDQGEFHHRLTTGDSAAWGELVEHFAPSLRALLGRSLHSHEEVEDLLQGVWCRVWKYFQEERFHAGQRMYPFLARASANAASDYLRARGRWRQVFELLQSEAPSPGIADRVVSPDVSDPGMLNDLFDCLNSKSELLPAFLWHLRDDFREKALAERFGLSPATAHRQKVRLIGAIRECCGRLQIGFNELQNALENAEQSEGFSGRRRSREWGEGYSSPPNLPDLPDRS